MWDYLFIKHTGKVWISLVIVPVIPSGTLKILQLYFPAGNQDFIRTYSTPTHMWEKVIVWQTIWKTKVLRPYTWWHRRTVGPTIYLLICKTDNCKKKNIYIGETKNMLKFCVDQHRGYVNNEKLDTASGAHFNLPGHSLSDLSVTILEKV